MLKEILNIAKSTGTHFWWKIWQV